MSLLRELQRIIVTRVKPLLEKENAWTKNHSEATKQLEKRLTGTNQRGSPG